MRFSKLFVFTTIFLALIPMSAALAQTYPSKTIEFAVHTGPGGGMDIIARIVADLINREKMISHPVVVVNKVGGGGAVATNYVAEKKDEHTLFPVPTTTFVGVFLKAKVQATRQDFIPLAMLGEDVQVFAVQEKSPYRTLKDLVAAAKEKPKKLIAGFGSIGGTGHLMAFLFAQKAGIQLTYLSHKSGGDAVISLLGGRVDLCTENPMEIIPHVRAKKLRIIGIGSAERHPALSDVPTVKEQGFDVDMSSGRGFLAFKGMSPNAVSYWESIFKKVYESETYQKFLKENMMRLIFLKGKEFGQVLDKKHEQLLVVLKDLDMLRK